LKWFKHLVDSGDDPDILGAIVKFGPTGYYVFFRILEIMSREFDVENPAVLRLNWIGTRFKLRLKSVTIKNVLDYYVSRNRFEYKIEGSGKNAELIIKCPKLKQLTDEYTAKKLREISGQTPDNSNSDVGIKSVIRQQITDNRLEKNKETGDPRGSSGLFFKKNMPAASDEIINKCEQIELLKLKNPKQINIYSWVQQKINISGHPQAILDSLDMVIKRWPDILDPWPYANAIFNLKNGNYWESEHIAEAEQFKKMFIADENIQNLIKSIGNLENEKPDQNDSEKIEGAIF